MKKFLALVVLSAFLGSCAGAPAKPGTADTCLFQPEKTAEVFVEYEGERIGFCCQRCQGKFEAMDDATKKAALSKRADPGRK